MPREFRWMLWIGLAVLIGSTLNFCDRDRQARADRDGAAYVQAELGRAEIAADDAAAAAAMMQRREAAKRAEESDR